MQTESCFRCHKHCATKLFRLPGKSFMGSGLDIGCKLHNFNMEQTAYGYPPQHCQFVPQG